jgi:hypothetical protein
MFGLLYLPVYVYLNSSTHLMLIITYNYNYFGDGGPRGLREQIKRGVSERNEVTNEEEGYQKGRGNTSVGEEEYQKGLSAPVQVRSVVKGNKGTF